MKATSEHGAYGGDPQREILERMRRLETRVTNTLRAIALLPHGAIAGSVGTVTYSDEYVGGQTLRTLHVSSPNVPIGEIGRVAVMRAPRDRDTVMQIMLCNVPWGQMVVHGEPYQPKGNEQ